MRPLKLIAAAVVFSVGGGWSMINAAEQQLNPKAISITLPNQFQWKRNEAAGGPVRNVVGIGSGIISGELFIPYYAARSNC